MHLLHLTDPHFNFLPEFGAQYIGEEFKTKYADCDGCLITGDISESKGLAQHIQQFVKGFEKPVYYVLGNHDYYGGKVGESERVMGATYLVDEAVVELSASTALVGDDGWYDATAGAPYWSDIDMSDFHVIEDFIGLGKYERIVKAQDLGMKATRRLEPKVRKAAKSYKKIIVGVHVPPYPEAAWHDGKMSDPNWLPWFSNVEMGKMLNEVAKEYPDVKFEAFCGHSHGGIVHQIKDNVMCTTGAARYGDPQISGLIEFE